MPSTYKTLVYKLEISKDLSQGTTQETEKEDEVVRQTEEAYLKGLKQGYALAEAQYKELLRNSEYGDVIDLEICKRCGHYKPFTCGINNIVYCCELNKCNPDLEN